MILEQKPHDIVLVVCRDQLAVEIDLVHRRARGPVVFHQEKSLHGVNIKYPRAALHLSETARVAVIEESRSLRGRVGVSTTVRLGGR